MPFVSRGSSEPGTETEEERAAFLDIGEELRSHIATDAARSSREPGGAAQKLLGVIEGEIVPRLLLAHKAGAEALADADPTSLRDEDHERFLDCVMHHSSEATRRCVYQLLDRGVTRESVCLELLSRAARRLGELWETDRCHFADVTIGLCRLHEVLRELFLEGQSGGWTRPRSKAPRILLATACGDQHVFGVVMVAEFFRAAGWRVWSEPGASTGELCALLSERAVDVLGISASCDTYVEAVASEIATLRKASCNVDLKVLLGGRLYVEEPGIIERLGADAGALEAVSAPGIGEDLISHR